MPLTRIQTAAVANSAITSVKIANSGITAGVYGNATSIPSLTVDSAGRISAAANVAVSIPAGANLQEFSSSGTWTKPAGATFVMVELWGAGGGGGSGRSAASSRGGGGGGGGAYGFRLLRAADLSASVAVTVGAGGAGGASVAAGGGIGLSGAAGGSSSFGSLLTIYGGSGGNGGQSSAVDGGAGGGVLGSSGIPEVNYSGASQPGHFGRGAIPSGGSPGAASAFGGGGGGASQYAGGSSYQGGPGGGGGGGWSSSVESGGVGGAITGSDGGTAAKTTYPGTAGAAGVGRQGGSGGASGYAAGSVCYNVAFGNGTFAAVSQSDGTILTSANGTSAWAYAQTPSGLPICYIAHDGTQFVLLNRNGTRCWTTTNFSSFTEQAAPSASPLSFSSAYPGIKYVNGNYFIAHSTGLLRSTDLVTWATVSTGLNSCLDICWSGTNYVVTSLSAPFVRYSSNLSSWSTPTGIAGQATYFCTSNGSGTVVITQNSSTQAYRSTDNGATFSSVATTLPGANAGLSYVASTYFYAGSNELWTSTDGNSWTQQVSTGSYNPYGSVAYNGTTLVLVNILSSTNVVITAVPASLGSWTPRNVTIRDVAGGAGGAGGAFGGGGGGGGGSSASFASGAGGNGGAGYARIYTW